MISKTYENYFYLLNCAIHKEKLRDKLGEDPDRLNKLIETDWQELNEIAEKTRTFQLIYPLISQFNEITGGIDKNLLEGLRRRALSITVSQFEKHKAIHAVLNEAKKRELEIIFFKGLILSALYPHYTQRTTFDADIFVREKDKSAAIRMLEDMGYTRSEQQCKNHVQVYRQASPYNVIELHTRLWEDYSGRQISILESMDITNPDNITAVQACGLEVLSLEPRRHLVFQIFHIVKHFMLDGVGMRYLLDISLFVDRYKDQIDFGVFWDDMEKLGYEQFCRHLFAVCIMYFGMDGKALRGRQAVVDMDTEILLFDILRGGTAYKKNAHWQILGTMIPYFVGEKEVRKSRIGRKLDAIFLRPSDLTKEYSYAKKNYLLLPVAWVHRAYKYILGYFMNKRILYSANEKLDVAEYRLHLMNRMGLVNEKK